MNTPSVPEFRPHAGLQGADPVLILQDAVMNMKSALSVLDKLELHIAGAQLSHALDLAEAELSQLQSASA